MYHQQLIPDDLHAHPRPGDREIRVKPIAAAHLERPSIVGDASEGSGLL